MKRKKMRKRFVVKKRPERTSAANLIKDSLAFHTEFAEIRKKMERLGGDAQKLEERLQDLEIHANLLTRLLTTLCIEKFGMRVGVLKRLIKRIEKEAIRDSQILHLESLYKLPHAEKKNPTAPPQDPWEDIS